MSEQINILLVEDDPQIALRTEALIHSLGYTLMKTVDNGTEAIQTIRTQLPDILVMDIELKGELTGIQVVEQVRDLKIPVIFTTGFREDEVYQAARDTQPAAYLLKPFNKFTFQTALETAIKILDKEATSTADKTAWSADVFIKDSFFIKQNNLLKKVKVDNIQYIQSEGNYCDIIASKKHVVKMSLTQLMKKLPSSRFLRVHQRYIIQADLIENIDLFTNEIQFGKQRIPFGPRYKDDILKILTRL